MMGNVILQAVAEIVLNVPSRKKAWRRLRWVILLVVLGIAVAVSVNK